MGQPLVSVITITRNRGKLIGRCIKSVLNQSYKNIEYIIVDGASEDNTDDVINSFHDSRIRFIKLKSNWPIVKTINYGVEISNGKYITFLDSDDEYLPSKVEKQVKLIESLSPDFGMVYCWMTYYDERTREIDHIHKCDLRGFVGDEVIERPKVSGTPTFMFRRDAFVENGGWRDNIGIISDFEMAARFCQKWKVDYVPESLINVYVNHSTQRMSDDINSKEFHRNHIIFEEYFLAQFKDAFDRRPEYRAPHLYALVQHNSAIGEKSKAWNYFIKYLRVKSPLKNKTTCLYHLLFGK